MPTYSQMYNPSQVASQLMSKPAPAPAQTKDVYWVGNDGNLWWKGSKGVVNMGQASGYQMSPTTFGATNAINASTQQTGNANLALKYATQIPNPGNPQPGDTPTDLNRTTSGGTEYQDTTASRNATLASITGVDQILGNKLAQEDTDYQKLIDQYTAEDADNLAAYNKQVEGNEQTREDNRQIALAGAAQGSRGLYATLASIGALGGTGRLLANRAVAKEANDDIGRSDKTFENNATTLFDTRSALEKQEKKRKEDAATTRDERKKGHKYDAAEKTQSLWKEMADYWRKAGNNAEADAAMGKAAGYTQQLVENTRPTMANYNRDALQYTAPKLASYLAGANDMTVNVAGGGQPINGAIYTSTKKREEL